MPEAKRTQKARARTSTALVVLFVLSFASNEWGVAHSLISLIFTGSLILHLRNNWARYRHSLKWTMSDRARRGVVDSAQLLVVLTVVVSGVFLWVADLQEDLHEFTGFLIVAMAVVHMLLHRRSLVRLVRQLKA